MSLVFTIENIDDAADLPGEFAVPEGETRIGRSKTNDLVLGSSNVSRLHASIRSEGGGYRIENHSANGTLINHQLLDQGQQAPLQDGDVVEIGSHRLYARLAAAAALPAYSPPPAPEGAWDSDDFLQDFAPGAPVPAGPPEHSASPSAPAGRDPLDDLVAPVSGTRSRDPLDDLGAAPQADQGPGGLDPVLSHGSPLNDHYASPTAEAGGGVLPENWDQSMVNIPPPEPPPSAPRVAPPPPAPPRPAASAPAAVAPPGDDYLRSAIAADPARFAQALRTIADGLITGLRARSQTKSAIDLGATIVMAKDNNPLKFSVDADDALAKMLQGGSAYLEMEAAFAEAFHDLRDHQLAMLTALRSTFDAIMENLGPETLKANCDNSGRRGSLLPGSGRGKYWEYYEELFADLQRDTDKAFTKLVSEPFSRKYAEQIRTLKTHRGKT